MHQESIEVHRPGGRIVPRSSGQAAYVRAIRQSDVVFCEGPAGCGKTFLAVRNGCLCSSRTTCHLRLCLCVQLSRLEKALAFFQATSSKN
jgi:ABC-type uncharacterized transport system YnjBCD ATPase subunit